MRAVAGQIDRGPIVSSAVVLSALSVLILRVLTGGPVLEVSLVVALVATLAVAYRSLLRWHSLLAGIIVVILFIPIRRYHLPADLPFDLEPYRLVVALVLAGWGTSLLIDPRVRLRRSPLDGPILLILFAAAASILANPARVNETSTNVVKSVTFFVSFVLLFYLIVSVTKSVRQVQFLVKLIVVGGTVLAVLALIERRTGYNLFNHLAGIVPLLRFEGGVSEDSLLRGVRLRVYGPAEHPIAFGALFVMIVPLAMYLARATGQLRWWVVQGLLCMAALATTSRTAVVMLLAVGVVFIWLKRRETLRLWPIAVPLLIIVHLVLPGTLGTLRASFLPEGGLLAEQARVIEGNELRANGRIADLEPTLREVATSPLFGIGFGTRLVGFEQEVNNAAILDNQWLGTLLETGVLGMLAWFWLFWLAVRRLGHAAKADQSPDGWLFAALAASLTAFAVGMLTYDALGFIQIAFVFFFLLSLGAALLTVRPLRERDSIVGSSPPGRLS